jgi:hypothetical protein
MEEAKPIRQETAATIIKTNISMYTFESMSVAAKPTLKNYHQST